VGHRRNRKRLASSSYSRLDVVDHFDDGGFSGGNMDRPAFGRLLDKVRAGDVDIIVVYKKLSRILIQSAEKIIKA
jgi:site-specific DNA recombinase